MDSKIVFGNEEISKRDVFMDTMLNCIFNKSDLNQAFAIKYIFARLLQENNALMAIIINEIINEVFCDCKNKE